MLSGSAGIVCFTTLATTDLRCVRRTGKNIRGLLQALRHGGNRSCHVGSPLHCSEPLTGLRPLLPGSQAASLVPVDGSQGCCFPEPCLGRWLLTRRGCCCRIPALDAASLGAAELGGPLANCPAAWRSPRFGLEMGRRPLPHSEPNLSAHLQPLQIGASHLPVSPASAPSDPDCCLLKCLRRLWLHLLEDKHLGFPRTFAVLGCLSPHQSPRMLVTPLRNPRLRDTAVLVQKS